MGVKNFIKSNKAINSFFSNLSATEMIEKKALKNIKNIEKSAME